MIHLDGETLTLAAFATRCAHRKMSNAQALAALGSAAIDPHAVTNALAQARRVMRGGELLQDKRWTDARVARLRELWPEGLSASQIAAELGGGITRNAVIGKVHRLGIEMRAKAPQRPRRAAKPKSVANVASTPARQFDPRKPMADRAEPFIAPKPAAAVLPADVSAPSSEPVTLLALRERMCKWPIGDVGTEAFHFCGGRTPDGAVYCSYHAQIAYQPSTRGGRKDGSWKAKGTSGYASARRLSCAESYRW